MGNNRIIDMKGWIGKNNGFPNSLLRVPEDAQYIVKNHHICWPAICECGNTTFVRGTELRYGGILSCGCLQRQKTREQGIKNGQDLTGKRFGSLIVVKKTDERYRRQIVWECKCDCGNIKKIASGDLLEGRTTSCGCRRRSLGAGKIKEILDQNNIKYLEDVEYFQDLITTGGGRGRYDFIIFNENNDPIKLIEFDGELHFYPIEHFGGQKDFEKRLQNDHIKNEYAWAHKIPIVRIPYTEKNITLETIMGDQYLVRPQEKEENNDKNK